MVQFGSPAMKLTVLVNGDFVNLSPEKVAASFAPVALAVPF